MIGETISHYRILAKLGEGGMGVVYRAHDERLDRDVAIKVLPEAVAADPERLARFEREAKAVAKIAHPNILEIFDFGREGEVTYAVTEVLDGETLCDRLQGGAVSWRQAAEIGAAIADGLAAAHHAGIVHRDLKPSNVFITSEGRVKILDFGLARHDAMVTGAATTQSPTLTCQTDPGTVLGTVGYMSPEQVRGDPVDGRSDIFSLGCVLYEMISGGRAFCHDTAVETMNAILNEEPAELSNTDTVLPVGTENTIRRCLEKRPEARFQSASDLAYNLCSLSSDSARSIAQGLPRATAWKGPAPWLSLATVAVLAVVVWIWAPWRETPAPLPEVVPNRVAVAPLENRTGDPAHDNLGVMAAESIIQRFAETGAAETIMISHGTNGISDQGYSSSEAPSDDQIIERAQQKGAALLLSGACYFANEVFQLQARLTDTSTSTLVHIFRAEVTDQRELVAGIAALSEKVVAGVAAHLDFRLDITVMRPPSSYAAYKAFQRSDELWSKDYPGAIRQLQCALDADPDFHMARLWIPSAYINLQDFAQAKETLEKTGQYLDRFTPFERAYFRWNSAYLAGDRVGDLAECRQMVKLAPRFEWVRYSLGLVAMEANRPREAIEAMTPVISSWVPDYLPQSWWSFEVTSSAYHHVGDYDQEIKYADLGIEHFPDVGNLYRHKAAALAARGQVEAIGAVVNDCLRTQRRGDNPGQVMSGVAAELRYHGHQAAAVEMATRSVAWFERQTAETDQVVEPSLNLWLYAYALRVAGQWQEARELLVELERRGWNPVHVGGALGIVAANMGDRNYAEQISEIIPATEAPFSGAIRLYWQSAIAAHLGEMDRAIRLLRKALAEGLPCSTNLKPGEFDGTWPLHSDMDLEPLWHYPPFEELIKPKG